MAKKYNICLDIGGTKILGVIFDQEKNIVYRINLTRRRISFTALRKRPRRTEIPRITLRK